ncbi:MAG TPA: mechanosensitive ion channel domain-containing protein [Sphingomicrobium sp.]|nr:mechanosensitive ion channel domain-containing protein [Sphingomicrobium sp.]
MASPKIVNSGGIEHSLEWIGDNLDRLAVGALIATGLVALMLVLRAIGRRILALHPEPVGWRGVIGRVLAKTSIFFMVAAALAMVASYAAVPRNLARLVDILFIIAAALQSAIWAREVILGVIRARVGDDPGTSTLGNAMSLIRVLVSVALFAIAIIVILDNLGVNVTALVAGLGIGGIAIGLAAQGIFSDLFAALAIVFDRPFRRGDMVRYDNTTGTVERIGLKTTRLRSLSGEQVIMANTKLLEREIHNLALASSRRVTLPFGLALDTSLDRLERMEALGERSATSRKGCKFVRCVLTALGSSSLNFELVYDDRALDNDKLAANRSAVLFALLACLKTEGIELAVSATAPAPAPPLPAPAQP